MSRVVGLWTAFCLVVVSSAAPLSPSGMQCATTCSKIRSKLHYKPGKTYVYKFSGHSSIQVDESNANINVHSIVELSVLNECEMALVVKDYTVKDDKEKKAQVSELPLLLAMQDGDVEHVCVDPQDDQTSINAKMGIVSSLHNSLPAFSEAHAVYSSQEVDIHGKCTTKYTLTKSENTVEVTKMKNNNDCSHRFHPRAENKASASLLNRVLPLKDSFSRCHQVVKDGIYESVECTDINVIGSMYGSDTGAAAFQKSKLVLQGERSSRITPTASTTRPPNRRNLTYLIPPQDRVKDDTDEMDTYMEELCRSLGPRGQPVKEEAAKYVLQVIRGLRQSDPEKVLQNIQRGRYCPDTEKLEEVFLDTVPFVGEKGIPVMVKAIVSGAVGGRTLLYASALHLVSNPSSRAVGALQGLLDMKEVSPTLLLAAGSTINAHCHRNLQCLEDPEVQNVLGRFRAKLQSLLSSKDINEKKEEILAILKTIGNMGLLSTGVAVEISDALEDKSNDVIIRVAAAQAFRNVPCIEKMLSSFNGTLLDPNELVEVRIAAYLSGIQCFSRDVLELIIKVMASEPNIQVRNFILTHLKNLQESDAPDNQEVRRRLADLFIPTDYSGDVTRFSKNVDLSHFFPKIGLGMGVSSNIIYSNDSVVPRFINLDFTSEYLHRMRNILEVGARFEGFSSHLETLFGPKSYITTSSWQTIWKDLVQCIQNVGFQVFDLIESKIRSKRSIDIASLSTFLKKLQLPERRTPSTPKADVFARLFGQEVSFGALSYDLKDFNVEQIFDTLLQYMVFKNLPVSTARAISVDFDYVIPTMLGIPLRLEVAGAAVVALELEDKTTGPQDSGSCFRLVPSISLHTDSFIGFELSQIKAGVMINKTLHSGSAGNVNIHIQKWKNIEITWDFPERLNLFSLKRANYLIDGSGMERGISPRPSLSDSRKSCSKVVSLGIDVCYETDFSGMVQNTVALWAEKADPSMNGYKFSAALKKHNEKSIKIELVKLGESQKNIIKTDIVYRYQEQDVTAFLDFSFPIGHCHLETSLVNSAQTKIIELHANYVIAWAVGHHHWKSNIIHVKEDLYNFESYYSHTKNFASEDQVTGGNLSFHNVDGIIRLDFNHHTLNKLNEIVSANCKVNMDVLLIKVYGYLVLIPTGLHRLDTIMKIPSFNVTAYTESDIRSSTNFGFNYEFSMKPNGYLIAFTRFTSNLENGELELQQELNIPMLSEEVSYDVYMMMLDVDEVRVLSNFQQGSSTLTVEGNLGYDWITDQVTCFSVFQIYGFAKGPHRISSEFHFSDNNDNVMGKIDIRNRTNELFKASFNKTETEITADLQVPPYIKVDLDILLSPMFIMNFGVMGQIRGSTSIKKYVAKIEYIMNQEQYGISARGYLLADSKKYPYTVKAILPSIISGAQNQENVLDIRVKTPTKKTLYIMGRYEPGQTNSEWVCSLKALDGQVYALEGYWKLKKMDSNNYEVTRLIGLKLSDLVSVDSRTITHHEKTCTTRKLDIRGESERWVLGPWSLEMLTVMKQNNWELSFRSASNNKQISSNGKVELAAPWWRSTGSMNVDVKLPGATLSSVSFSVKSSSDPSIVFHLNDVYQNQASERKLLVRYHSRTDTWVAKVNTSSCTLEAHMIPQFPVYTVKLWTNLERKPDRFYEITYTSPQEVGEDVKVMSWSLLGPEMSKPVVIKASHAKQASMISIKVDVYQKEEDRTEMMIAITKESEASYKANAIVKSKVIEHSPSVDVHLTITHELKHVNMIYKTHHSSHAGEVNVKWDENHAGKIVATVLVRSPQSKIDVSSVIKQKETTDCHGYQAESQVFSPSGGWHLGALLCSPFFIGIDCGKLGHEGSETLYHVHVGVRDPREAALVVLKENFHQNEIEPIVGVQLSLISPYLNKFRVTYREPEVALLRRKLGKVARKWRRAFLVSESVSKTVKTKTKSLELNLLAHSLHEDWGKISAELKKDSLNLALRNIYSSKGIYETAGSKVAAFTEICNSFMQIYRKLTLTIAKRTVELGEMVYKETTKALQNRMPEYAEEIWQILRIQSYWMQEKFMSGDLRYMWAEGLTPEKIDSFIRYTVEAVTGFSADPGHGTFSFPIPMARPVYSIVQVPSGFTVPDTLPMFRNIKSVLGFFIPRLYVPWGSVQASYGSSGALRTFDGLALHVRPSHCQYVLATDKDDYIAIAFDEGEWSQIVMTTMNGRCIIQIDKNAQVKANGHLVDRDTTCDGHVTVRDWLWQVVVEMPWLSVSVDRIRPREVVVEAGLFYKNRLVGLLGTYNDFTDDDMTTPTGQITNSPSYFLNAWKIDSSCQ